MRWFVQVAGRVYEIRKPRYIREQPDVVLNMYYFLTELHLFDIIDAKFYKDESMFFFQCDPNVQSYEVNIKNVIAIQQDTFHKPRTAMSKFYRSPQLQHYLQRWGIWNWWEKQITIMGPVSMYHIHDSLREILLFGDRHDNLNVDALFTHQQVKDQWGGFFGTMRDLANPDIDRFKFMVTQLSWLRYTRKGTGSSLQLFIWEFLILVLMGWSSDVSLCIDVFLEDALLVPFEGEVNNYLEAVRHLFALCPYVVSSTISQQSLFASRLRHCRELFPQLRLHRIDLRFAVTEDVVGSFENDDPSAVVSLLAGVLLFIKEEEEEAGNNNAERAFTEAVIMHHKMNNNEDILLLWNEFNMMQRAFFRREIADDIDGFVHVFGEAVHKYWKPSFSEGKKWFLFRTCMTDIYGLSRLLRSKNLDDEKQELRKTTCQHASFVHNAIVYVGAYHTDVWAHVLRNFKGMAITSRKKQMLPDKRSPIKLEAMHRKPFMHNKDFEDEDSIELMLERWIDDPSPWQEEEEKKKKKQQTTKNNMPSPYSLQFVSMLNPTSLKTFFVPILAKKLLHEQWHPDSFPTSFWPRTLMPYITSANTLIERRREAEEFCDDTTDVVGIDIATMSMKELLSLYEGKHGKCYSALAMYKWWETCFAERRAFRDPIHKTAISRTEENLILAKAGKLKPPLRLHLSNRFAWTLQYVVLDTTIGLYNVHIMDAEDTSFIAVCHVRTLDQKLYFQIQEALQEVMYYSQIEVKTHIEPTTGQKERLLFHPTGIHFASFRVLQRWMTEPYQTLLQFLEELTPFISFDFNKIAPSPPQPPLHVSL